MSTRLQTRAWLLLGGVPGVLLVVVAAGTFLGFPRWLQLGLLAAALASIVFAALNTVKVAASVERFLAAMLAALRSAERTGELRSWNEPQSNLEMLQELAHGYEHAAASISGVQERRRQAYVESLGALAMALDARDPYTAGHSRRVSRSACAVGRAMGLSVQQVERIRVGSILHDIGKITISDVILGKQGPLNDEEAALVQEHPTAGRKILEDVHGFTEFLDAVEQHHENWDGSGYPRGLRQEEISVEARVIHVADAYDAMTTDRCYRTGMSHEVAIRILWSCSGTQFDPAVVGLFAALPQDTLDEMRAEAAQEMLG